jgi:hypothetical protein
MKQHLVSDRFHRGRVFFYKKYANIVDYSNI